MNCALSFFRIRSLGSAALNACMVASGRADAYYEYGVHCWDIAAAVVIVREAGGVCIMPTGEWRGGGRGRERVYTILKFYVYLDYFRGAPGCDEKSPIVYINTRTSLSNCTSYATH